MVGTSRAGRPSKDKNAKSTSAPATQTLPSKTDRAAAKHQPQATVEQLRMAQMIDSGKDAANEATVKQLMEMTGRTEIDVVVALHDAQDDPDKAVLLLLEGEQGCWEEQGKKKKKNTVKSEKEAPLSIPENEAGDSRPDRSRDRRDHDRHDVPPRRGRDRRNGGPPPRLARGRGRDRNFGGSGGGNRDRDRSNFNGEQEREADWDAEPIDTHNRRPERGQFGERGRGRGRGGFGRPSARGGRPRRFDRQNESSDGPHIDTWTNETAENAEKENIVILATYLASVHGNCTIKQLLMAFLHQKINFTVQLFDAGWGETWGEATEDWSEDTWTGSLDESKVFTSSQTNSMGDSDLTPALNDTNTLGQRLDVGSLFSKSAEFAKAPDFTKTNESGGDSFFSQYNQQATESIKNSIGIGSSPRQNLSNIPASQPQQQPQPLGQLGSMPQREMGPSVHGSLPSSVSHPMMPPATSSALQQSSSQQQVQRRPQRSKLPPPSKIPQSAVEMPGHMMPQLDVQFGVDFGSDSGQFGFGSSGGGGDSSSVPTFTSSTSSGSSALSNHLGQTNKAAVDSSRQSSVMSSPSAGSKPQQSSSLPPMDGSPSRPSVFPNSVYTTPTKSDSQSLGQSANKVTPEPIPFPSPSDHKSSGLVNSQRTAQSPAALSQGSLSTSKPDTLPNFSAANGYAASSYSAHAGHKSGGHSSSGSSGPQTFPHTAATSQPSASNYQNQYASQNQYPGAQVAHGSQSQFPSAGQTQYPGSNQQQYHGASTTGSSGSGQTQFMPSQAQYQSGQGAFPAPPATQTQYQSAGSQYGGYQSGSSSFQNQSGMSSAASSQSAQNSLYPASTQQSGSSYPTGSSSFHVRDSQSASSLQGSGVSQPSNSYQTPPAPGLKAVTTQQSVSSYSSQTYSGSHSSQHPQNLQPSPLANKLGDSISKMSLKDTSMDSRSSSQYDHGSTSTTSASMTTTSSSSISTVTSTVSATSTPVATSSTLNSRASATLPLTTKAPPNLPPGVPLLNPQYIMGQAGTLPPFYGLQQPVYGYEDMQMLQQRLPALQTGTGYYDMSAFPGVPSTIAGRDQAAALGTAPFTGTGTDNKPLNRVEAQSPNASNQQQSTHNAPQQTLPFNIHYGYYYPGAVLPGTASFQYPTMFPMPPVTNAPAPHVPGTTTATQLPKTYGSHQGYVSKGYEEVGSQELSKAGYAGLQQPTKVAGGSQLAVGFSSVLGASPENFSYLRDKFCNYNPRTGTTADINTAAYTKSHTQGFDKQGFPGGTPPPFSLPLASASQAGPLGAPAAPYGAPFLPMMPPQPHNQTILHHPLQQDSGAGSARGLQQPANQAKTGGAKPYGTYWGN
ncbi:hypothetical protein BaRGS_00033637 [Batillaria attramentaria]|uniref:UBA domain-containing protein n=1 Tax=Batillaria attramentaria TaxID=370345 RepID=A0ABD0JJM7_9CAEN